MPKPDFHDTVLPRGSEGLGPEGGWKEGEPLVSPEARDAINQEAGRVQALNMAAQIGRAEGARAAEAVVNREKDAKAGQLKAFKSFLWSLEELAAKDAGAVADPETKLIFRLYRLEDVGGANPKQTYQTNVSFGASEALGMGDPDFEGRAQAWGEKTGRFGRFRWRILGWAAGEQTLDTTYDLNTEAPAGYEPPKAPVPELVPEPPKDPMTNLKEGLSLINLVKETLGGQSSGKPDTDAIRSAARAEALIEGDRELRKEISKLEDRWEAKVEAAKKDAYDRGIVDGRRQAEDEYRPKLWDLERKLDAGKEPSFIEEAVRFAGGPEVVQSLAQAVIAGMNAPKTAPQPRTRPVTTRPVMPLQPRPNPQAAPVVQTPPPAVLPEPTRAEWREALEETEEALEIIAEHGDGSSDIEQLKAILEAFVQQGQEDGPLGPWWQAWNQVIGKTVTDFVASFEAFQGAQPSPAPDATETPMDLNALKTLLMDRLAGGATNEEISAELIRITTPDQRDQWRKMLAWIPESVAVEMIGDGRDPERIKALLTAFLAEETRHLAT